LSLAKSKSQVKKSKIFYSNKTTI